MCVLPVYIALQHWIDPGSGIDHERRQLEKYIRLYNMMFSVKMEFRDLKSEDLNMQKQLPLLKSAAISKGPDVLWVITLYSNLEVL